MAAGALTKLSIKVLRLRGSGQHLHLAGLEMADEEDVLDFLHSEDRTYSMAAPAVLPEVRCLMQMLVTSGGSSAVNNRSDLYLVNKVMKGKSGLQLLQELSGLVMSLSSCPCPQISQESQREDEEWSSPHQQSGSGRGMQTREDQSSVTSSGEDWVARASEGEGSVLSGAGTAVSAAAAAAPVQVCHSSYSSKDKVSAVLIADVKGAGSGNAESWLDPLVCTALVDCSRHASQAAQEVLKALAAAAAAAADPGSSFPHDSKNHCRSEQITALLQTASVDSTSRCSLLPLLHGLTHSGAFQLLSNIAADMSMYIQRAYEVHGLVKTMEEELGRGGSGACATTSSTFGNGGTNNDTDIYGKIWSRTSRAGRGVLRIAADGVSGGAAAAVWSSSALPPHLRQHLEDQAVLEGREVSGRMLIQLVRLVFPLCSCISSMMSLACSTACTALAATEAALRDTDASYEMPHMTAAHSSGGGLQQQNYEPGTSMKVMIQSVGHFKESVRWSHGLLENSDLTQLLLTKLCICLPCCEPEDRDAGGLARIHRRWRFGCQVVTQVLSAVLQKQLELGSAMQSYTMYLHSMMPSIASSAAPAGKRFRACSAPSKKCESSVEAVQVIGDALHDECHPNVANEEEDAANHNTIQSHNTAAGLSPIISEIEQEVVRVVAAVEVQENPENEDKEWFPPLLSAELSGVDDECSDVIRHSQQVLQGMLRCLMRDLEDVTSCAEDAAAWLSRLRACDVRMNSIIASTLYAWSRDSDLHSVYDLIHKLLSMAC
ncbi:hypothetical protein CEUSTIGMA_g3261.t1 [Chlamydomonas eustigma]|uniref:Uncharacterized protein n=1 Tax=Chlamydomonas eustigma TaxID=1157962 RepID=A0A250WY91_9CHLO|nr:hypothetical protein CEUSTIGMA_g3261.t1 [Chlamydomonas eustigma]|eukprot:GAX75818.1 hypothetical protein CEUSTIGMA_g3261.t1 [Chlamydomonas eustigma]